MLPVNLAVFQTSKFEVRNTTMLPGSVLDLKSRGPQHCQVDWQCSGPRIFYEFEVPNAAREARNSASEVPNTASEVRNSASEVRNSASEVLNAAS